jgi:hypothetical protein
VIRRIAVAAFALLALAPTRAHAQFDWVGGLVSRMTDISIAQTIRDQTPTWDGSTIERASASRGMGIELLFELTPLTRPRAPSEPSALARDSVAPLDTLITIEIGIGYFENPFRIEAPEFSMRGALRDLPMVTAYASINCNLLTYVPSLFSDCGRDTDHLFGLNVYAAVRGGLVELQGTRAYVASETPGRVTALVADGEAFRSGLAGGAVLSIGRLHLFAEAEWTRRRIPSVEWDGEIDENLPRNLDFRDVLYVVGLQFRVGGG